MHFNRREASTASRTALVLITGRVPGVAQSNRETVVFGGADDPAAACSELDLQNNGEKGKTRLCCANTEQTVWRLLAAAHESRDQLLWTMRAPFSTEQTLSSHTQKNDLVICGFKIEEIQMPMKLMRRMQT